MSTELRQIPTNIITGFLGVGKTTAISYFLKHKPVHERWAVLVNEFGEIGIDGSLLQGQHPEREQVYVAEVPGGCMCCVMGLPTKVTLNKLLQQAKPDRLLIEPTGLGHPQEVLDLLSSEQYRDVLDVRTTITLVDARVISDARYTDHAIFNQQLQVADLIVANKSDCYGDDLAQLTRYLAKITAGQAVPVIDVVQGQIELGWLDSTSADEETTEHCHLANHSCHSNSHQEHVQHHSHNHHDDHSHIGASSAEQTIPEQGYIEISNHKGEFHSRGWRFDDSWVFEYERVKQALASLTCLRMKAVFETSQGPRSFSLSDGVLSKTVLQRSQGNRIELIDTDQACFTRLLDDLLAAISSP